MISTRPALEVQNKYLSSDYNLSKSVWSYKARNAPTEFSALKVIVPLLNHKGNELLQNCQVSWRNFKLQIR